MNRIDITLKIARDCFFICFLITTHLSLFAQQDLNQPIHKLNIGYSYGLMYQQSNNDANSTMMGCNIGYISTQNINNKYSLSIGINYTFENAANYLNSVNYISNWVGGPEITKVNLKSCIKLEYIDVPIIIKKRFKNNLNFGLGVNLSYLINANFNQEALGQYSVAKYPLADNDFTASVKYVYSVKNYSSTSAFRKTNFAPFFNIGYAITRRIDLEYFLSYDILSNPVLEYKFNEFNLLKNSLLLTFKLKKP